MAGPIKGDMTEDITPGLTTEETGNVAQDAARALLQSPGALPHYLKAAGTFAKSFRQEIGDAPATAVTEDTDGQRPSPEENQARLFRAITVPPSSAASPISKYWTLLSQTPPALLSALQKPLIPLLIRRIINALHKLERHLRCAHQMERVSRET